MNTYLDFFCERMIFRIHIRIYFNSLVCFCWFLLHLFWFEDTLTEKQNSWSHICRRKLFSKCHRKMQKCKITGQGMCVNYASSNVLSNEKISEQFNSLSAQPLSVSLPPYIEYFYRSDERLRSALHCYCLRYDMTQKILK